MKQLLKLSLPLALLATLANATPYTIDPVHSDVSFKVTHLSISKVRGNFTKFDAVIDFDRASNEVKAFEANIDASSINTDNEKRDTHLKSADFFETDKFSKITFKMTKYEKENNKEGKIYGEITMRGVTKPLVLDFEVGGFVKNDTNEKMGFSIDGELKRKDFGLGMNSPELTISDEVDIQIQAEASIKK